jgi:hypothetical protein
MRYYDEETDYPFDYANMVENAQFDDLIDEEDGDDLLVFLDEEANEWVDSYHNLAEDLADE